MAEIVSAKLSVPTIGIGAGLGCDGQVLVVHDLLGLFQGNTPSFVKQYANLAELMKQAFAEYHKEVQAGEFPAEEHTRRLDPEVYQELLKIVGEKYNI